MYALPVPSYIPILQLEPFPSKWMSIVDGSSFSCSSPKRACVVCVWSVWGGKDDLTKQIIFISIQ